MKYVYKSIWHRLADYSLATLFVLGIIAAIGLVVFNVYATTEFERTIYEHAKNYQHDSR